MNEQRQELNQKQGLILTPALTQALHMLTMPILELSEYARQQIEENPLLELASDYNEADSPNYSSYNIPENFKEGSSDYRPEPADMEEQSLYSLLRLQVAAGDAPASLRQDALYIIEHLDEDGYLSLPLPDSYEEALHLVQSLEPAGVGARDMRECLRLQISIEEPQHQLLLAIIDNFLPQVAKNQALEVARALKTTTDRVEQAFARIRSLHPRPAAGFSGSNRATPYIMPDIIIREAGNAFVAGLNDTMEPRLHISDYYSRLARQLREDAEAAEYLRLKILSAQTLISNMEKRRQTLIRLAQITADKQQAFFRGGLQNLAPMTMKDVAEQADLHESTVSRAVAGKYAQTPRGVFEWKFFFPRAYATEKGIITPAWAKQQLAALIAGEDKRQPYSDRQLCELLADQGLLLARRTVAKYREDLRLPPRYLRRKHLPKT